MSMGLCPTRASRAREPRYKPAYKRRHSRVTEINTFDQVTEKVVYVGTDIPLKAFSDSLETYVKRKGAVNHKELCQEIQRN